MEGKDVLKFFASKFGPKYCLLFHGEVAFELATTVAILRKAPNCRQHYKLPYRVCVKAQFTLKLLKSERSVVDALLSLLSLAGDTQVL